MDFLTWFPLFAKSVYKNATYISNTSKLKTTCVSDVVDMLRTSLNQSNTSKSILQSHLSTKVSQECSHHLISVTFQGTKREEKIPNDQSLHPPTEIFLR